MDDDARAAALVRELAAGYPFELDDFQRRGCLALAAGRGTLVAAPTGAGKTVVGELAVALALRSGGKAFYTTPLKALSNQKYGDFVARYGGDLVGLLTGDNSINGEAPVVVMTTEVLRNMLYEGSPTLSGLRYVVMDEVHYLQDRVRGAVWEEVLINLPADVVVASLSATVSNAEEFGEWLEATRGVTEVVIEERRPVPLDNYYLIGRELHPLLVHTGDGEPIPNPAIVRRTQRELLRASRARPRRGGRGPRAVGAHWVPSRIEVVDLLADEALLPAIYFVFSRAGCDQAVAQCRAANLRLTSPDERARIRERLDRKVAAIDPADLAALNFDELADSMARGIASHHAGMLPLFKEAVEELFAEGLIKVVFATETLSLGINMPARTVAIERLTKWQGERHELLTPGEYTQLTGRAGRRGIDERGAAVVLHQPFTGLDQIAGMASTRTYPLTSSFRPSYNMAVNLVANYRRDEAERLLASSFAQFLADRTVHGAEQKLARNRDFLAGYLQSAACERGDVEAYWELRRGIRAREGELSRDDRRARDAAIQGLGPGSVVYLPRGGRRGLAAVLSRAGMLRDGTVTGLLVLTEDRRVRRVGAREIGDVPVEVGRVALPRALSPKSPRYKARVAEALAEIDPPPRPGGRRRRASAADDPELARLRAELRDHPVHGCSDLPGHERWMQRYERLARDTDALADRVHRRSGSLVRTFDRVLAVLARLGYTDDFHLTAKGQTLRRLYAETDLLVAEAVHRGQWRGLEPAELAAVVSSLVYEARGGEGPPGADRAGPPPARVRKALDELAALHAELRDHEEDAGLEPGRPIDAGFADAAHRWASGETLEAVLVDEEVTPGDFVRVTKQLIDLLRQIALVTEGSDLSTTASAAAGACQRGVVAYSGLV